MQILRGVRHGAWAAALLAAVVIPASAQTRPAQAARAAGDAATVSAELPPGYVIGAEDVLSVVFWRDKELSADVVVRPDGRISLPLLNDVDASGLTPEQLAESVEKAASKYITDPDATVIVKEIRSRKVSVLGEVGSPGTVALTREMNVLQLIAEVGGLLEWADRGGIVIIRQEGGAERRYKFNYDDVIKGKNLQQNIQLKPGDIMVVR